MTMNSKVWLCLASGVFCVAAAGVAADEGRPPFRSVEPTTNGGDTNGRDPELDALQLSGISSVGGVTMFNLVDSRNNKSFWLSLTGTENGFSVISHDSAHDSVVVQRGGFSRIVPLRFAKITAVAAPAQSVPVASTPQPMAPPEIKIPSGSPTTIVHTVDGSEISNPKTPAEIAQAETEARMLVSDLLDISMRERERQKQLREAEKSGAPPR